MYSSFDYDGMLCKVMTSYGDLLFWLWWRGNVEEDCFRSIFGNFGYIYVLSLAKGKKTGLHIRRP